MALAFINVACSRGPEPTLSGLDSLLASRRFDEVNRRLDAYLDVHPDSVQAHVLKAQVALARDPQQPQVALEHLARVRIADRPVRAVVKLNEGMAYAALGDHVKAEASWREALRIDPSVPEAGWALLSLYYIEGRRQEAEQLGLALYAIEPDPRDRVQLLLELVRQDVKPPAQPELIRLLEPMARNHPHDLHATIALIRAYFRYNRPDEGLALLNPLLEKYPDNPDLWDAMLRGLDDLSRPDQLAETLARLPRPIAGDPRFTRYIGIAAQNRHDWAGARAAFERAREYDPFDTQLLYRLARVLRLMGEDAAAGEIDAKLQTLRELLPLHTGAESAQGPGMVSAPNLYLRIAEARERLGYRAEALAWYRLVLRDRPDDAAGLAAVARLADVVTPTLTEVLADSGGGR
jgi:tetratricopeptide (TPR) repeat protein